MRVHGRFESTFDYRLNELLYVGVSLAEVVLTQNDFPVDGRGSVQSWLFGIAGWFFPGAGHLLQGQWVRALILGGAVWVCFVAGLSMGGHLFSVTGNEQGLANLLQVPPTIANLGSGILYIVCWLLGVGLADDPVHAARATYEYGNTFLLIAGLLNYLAMLDAFDISAGRKP